MRDVAIWDIRDASKYSIRIDYSNSSFSQIVTSLSLLAMTTITINCMNLFQTITLAIIQGITEFLPISSSAHLEFVPWLLSWPNPSLTFDAALHLGTALAVLTFYAKELLQLIKDKSSLLLYIIFGNIPAIIFGYFGEKFLDPFFHQSSRGIPFMATGLIVFGLIMWWIDKTSTQKRELKDVTLKDSIILGCAQALALIPGVSRSGITITTGRFRMFNRESATYISFLLGLPVTLGAALYKSIDIFTDATSVQESGVTLFIGGITAFIVGLVSIKWLLQYLRNHPLKIFVYYRILVGSIILFLWMLG